MTEMNFEASVPLGRAFLLSSILFTSFICLLSTLSRVSGEKNLVDWNANDFAELLCNGDGSGLRENLDFPIRITGNPQFLSNLHLGESSILARLFDRKAHVNHLRSLWIAYSILYFK